MCVIRKFATKVAITPERIPFHQVPSEPVDRHKGNRLPFVPCLFITMSVVDTSTMLLWPVRWQKQPAMSRLASNRTVKHISFARLELRAFVCTPASTKEPKSGDKNSLHLCDSIIGPCVVFTEAVFGHFTQDNSVLHSGNCTEFF